MFVDSGDIEDITKGASVVVGMDEIGVIVLL
jgi:hypothetical protein